MLRIPNADNILGCVSTDIRRNIDRYDIIYPSAEGFSDTSIYILGNE